MSINFWLDNIVVIEAYYGAGDCWSWFLYNNGVLSFNIIPVCACVIFQGDCIARLV